MQVTDIGDGNYCRRIVTAGCRFSLTFSIDIPFFTDALLSQACSNSRKRNRQLSFLWNHHPDWKPYLQKLWIMQFLRMNWVHLERYIKIVTNENQVDDFFRSEHLPQVSLKRHITGFMKTSIEHDFLISITRSPFLCFAAKILKEIYNVAYSTRAHSLKVSVRYRICKRSCWISYSLIRG